MGATKSSPIYIVTITVKDGQIIAADSLTITIGSKYIRATHQTGCEINRSITFRKDENISTILRRKDTHLGSEINFVYNTKSGLVCNNLAIGSNIFKLKEREYQDYYQNASALLLDHLKKWTVCDAVEQYISDDPIIIKNSTLVLPKKYTLHGISKQTAPDTYTTFEV